MRGHISIISTVSDSFEEVDLAQTFRSRGVGPHVGFMNGPKAEDQTDQTRARWTALTGVAGRGLLLDVNHRPIIDAGMDREIRLRNLNQVDVVIATESARVPAEKR